MPTSLPRPAALLVLGFGVVVSIATSPPPPTVEVEQRAPIDAIEGAVAGEVLCLTLALSPNDALDRIDHYFNSSLELSIENQATGQGELSVWPVERCDASFEPDPEAYPSDFVEVERGGGESPQVAPSFLYLPYETDQPEQSYVLWLEGAAEISFSGEVLVVATSHAEDVKGSPNFTLEVR